MRTHSDRSEHSSTLKESQLVKYYTIGKVKAHISHIRSSQDGTEDFRVAPSSSRGGGACFNSGEGFSPPSGQATGSTSYRKGIIGDAQHIHDFPLSFNHRLDLGRGCNL